MTNMYVLFREMHWKPSDFYFMPEGEKIIVRAMLLKFSEETKKEQEKLEKMRRANR